MRTIKFRAWNKKEKKYLNSRMLIDKYHAPVIPHRNHFELNQKFVIYEQFTGLKDHKGKEIFEGDIVEFDPKEWGSNEGNCWVVGWHEKNGEWDTGGGTNSECSSWKTVIGNIHENPELLTPDSPKDLS